MSHTLDLENNAIHKIQEYTYNQWQSSFVNVVPINKRFRRSINNLFEKFGFHIMGKALYDLWGQSQYIPMGKWSCMGTSVSVLNKENSWDNIYNLLADADSKLVYDWFIQYRLAYTVLGNLANNIFKPPIDEAKYYEKLHNLKNSSINGFYKFDTYKINSDDAAIIDSCIYEQYKYNKIGPETGNIVLDIGAYKGETALWFSTYIGDKGRVYAFEPSNESYSYLQKNILINSLEHIIIPEKLGIYKEKTKIGFADTGGSGNNISNLAATRIDVISIDDFMIENRLQQLNYIKMDIEGGEMDALIGGENTIQKFKPTLAISAYHKPEDLLNIVNYLHKIVPEYKYYLSHKSPVWNETVVFASI